MILYKKDVIDKLSEKTGLYKKDIKAMLVALNELVYEERIYCVVVIKSMRQIGAASCRRQSILHWQVLQSVGISISM